MEIVGKIKQIMDVQVVNDRFKKREFVISTDLDTPYPQHILFQATQDKCVMLDKVKDGDEVKVYFNVRGREWTRPQDNQVKYFVTLEAWRIDLLVASAIDDNVISGETTDVETDLKTNENENDGLPF